MSARVSRPSSQAAEAQRTFLTNLLQLPNRPAPAGGVAAGEDWGKVLGLVAKDLAPVNKAILEAGVRIRDVDRRIRDAEGRLRAEAPAQEQRVEVKVDVAAGPSGRCGDHRALSGCGRLVAAHL